MIIEKQNKKISNRIYPILSARNGNYLNKTISENQIKKTSKENEMIKENEIKKSIQENQIYTDKIKQSQKNDIVKSFNVLDNDADFDLEEECKPQKVYNFQTNPNMKDKNQKTKEEQMLQQSQSCLDINQYKKNQYMNQYNSHQPKKLEEFNTIQKRTTNDQSIKQNSQNNQYSVQSSQTDEKQQLKSKLENLKDKFQQNLNQRFEIQSQYLNELSSRYCQSKSKINQSILSNHTLNDNQNNKSKLDNTILEKNEIYNYNSNQQIYQQNLNISLRQQQLDKLDKSLNQSQYTHSNLIISKQFQSLHQQDLKSTKNHNAAYMDIKNFNMKKNNFYLDVNQNQQETLDFEQQKQKLQRIIYNDINKALEDNRTDDSINFINTHQFNINTKFSKNWGVIHFACKFSNEKLLDFILEKNGDLNLLNKKQQTGLFICLKFNQLEFFKLLLNYEVSLNLQDIDGNTILHYAVRLNNYDFVKYLLTLKKLNINIQNMDGKKAIQKCLNPNMKQIFENFLSPKIVSRKIQLDDLIIHGLIGKGSYGEVFLVELKENQQKFAMKILQKKSILEQNLVEYILCEKNILQTLNHPFIVKLRYSFQNHSYLFMIIDLCSRGDLEQLIKKQKILSEEQVRFYMAEVLLGIEYLHQNNIIYRDLKPENIVLDEDGHAKITDFGLAKQNIINNTSSFCGTYAYLAPEMINKKGHNKTIDWYIYGTVIYEFLTGIICFIMFQIKVYIFQIIQVQKLNLQYHKFFYYIKLMVKIPEKRLGYNGAQEIKNHNFFKSIDWNKLYKKEIQPPILQQKIILKKDQGTNVTQQIKYQSYKVKQWSFYQK